MKSKNSIVIATLALSFLCTTASVSQAKTEASVSQHVTQFSRIEQPLSVKILVTLGGLGLIGAELWWFLWSKTQAQKAVTAQGIQELEIVVDGGYIPDRIQVNPHQLVRLNFLRKDTSSCLEKVLLPDFHQALDLPLNQVKSMEFMPTQTGHYTFHCGMNMFKGVVEVRETQS